MTAERRLAKLEGALSPKAATLLWLEEAQQFRSLPAYVAWLIDQPISASPLERVPAQARTAVVEAMRGQPREAVREAAHGAVRDGLFLVELVLRLNSVAEETIRMEGPRYAIFFWEMRALSAETTLAWRNRSRVARSTSSLAEHWQAWCEGSTGLLTGIYAAEEARALLERRYLDVHPALFPEAVEDWARLLEQAERLVGLGDALRPLMVGTPRLQGVAAGIDLDALRDRARALAATLVGRLLTEARAATLDILGDTDAATALAARQLRSNAAPASTLG
jgi:hypothetical protein